MTLEELTKDLTKDLEQSSSDYDELYEGIEEERVGFNRARDLANELLIELGEPTDKSKALFLKDQRVLMKKALKAARDHITYATRLSPLKDGIAQSNVLGLIDKALEDER